MSLPLFIDEDKDAAAPSKPDNDVGANDGVRDVGVDATNANAGGAGGGSNGGSDGTADKCNDADVVPSATTRDDENDVDDDDGEEEERLFSSFLAGWV
jgi:hypothetical protein